jgi:hypothetical protein
MACYQDSFTFYWTNISVAEPKGSTPLTPVFAIGYISQSHPQLIIYFPKNHSNRLLPSNLFPGLQCKSTFIFILSFTLPNNWTHNGKVICGRPHTSSPKEFCRFLLNFMLEFCTKAEQQIWFRSVLSSCILIWVSIWRLCPSLTLSHLSKSALLAILACYWCRNIAARV